MAENMGNPYETNLTLSEDLDEAIRQINRWTKQFRRTEKTFRKY